MVRPRQKSKLQILEIDESQLCMKSDCHCDMSMQGKMKLDIISTHVQDKIRA